MKEIVKKKEVTEIVYEASDGTQFPIKSECEKYEQTAKCALVTMYESQIQKLNISEFHITGYFGSEEFYYDIVKINNSDDLELIIKLHVFFGNLNRNDLPPYELNKIKFITECYNKGHHILIEKGDAYSQYIRISNVSLESLIEKLNFYIKETDKIIDKNENNN